MADLLSADTLAYIGTSVGSVIIWIAGSNTKLKEGISDWLLKRLNKTKINHIPLNRHRIFGALHQKRSSFTYFIMDEPIKIAFYKTYVTIKFDALEKMALAVAKLANEKGDITSLILNQIEIVTEEIDNNLKEKLIIPEKIEQRFSQWRIMLKASLKDSLIEILNDDLVDSNYFMAYRTLDTMIAHVKTILHSGTLEFSRMNGAFKNLEIKDVIR